MYLLPFTTGLLLGQPCGPLRLPGHAWTDRILVSLKSLEAPRLPGASSLPTGPCVLPLSSPEESLPRVTCCLSPSEPCPHPCREALAGFRKQEGEVVFRQLLLSTQPSPGRGNNRGSDFWLEKGQEMEHVGSRMAVKGRLLSPFRGLVWLGDWGGFKSVSSPVSTDCSNARLRRSGHGMGRRESRAWPLASSPSVAPQWPSPPLPPVLAPRVEFLTCAMAARWVAEGEQFGGWNQPEITSVKHTPFPDSGHCRGGGWEWQQLRGQPCAWGEKVISTGPLWLPPLQTLAGPLLGRAPSCLLTPPGRLSASALLHRPGRLAADQHWAHVSSR